MIKSGELEKLISDLSKIAKKDGGLGLNTAPSSAPEIIPVKEKNKLTKEEKQQFLKELKIIEYARFL